MIIIWDSTSTQLCTREVENSGTEPFGKILLLTMLNDDLFLAASTMPCTIPGPSVVKESLFI